VRRTYRLLTSLFSLFFVIGPFALISAAASPQPRQAQTAAPQITKLEPPNWWIDFVPELQLLITGENLEGATVTCSSPGVSIARSKVTDGGHYVFAWLNIAPDARPGTAALQVRTAAGSASVNFPIEERPSSAGKFQGFSQDDVIYLIMPDRFADGDPSNDKLRNSPGTYDRSKPRAYHGGDLRGIRDHLAYLRDLGITTIWLTPIVQNDPGSAQDYHGYGAVDEYAVEDHFGTLADLQDLVQSAHAKGLKVVLDFVPNHVGPHHPWVDAPPEPDWFHGTREHHTSSNGNFQPLADPHASPRLWRDVVDGWFAGILPDLNQDNPDVAMYYTQNAFWWAEQTGIDAYRLDTFPYVSRKFWSQWHRALFSRYPRMTTIGEVFDRDPGITAFFAGGRPQFDGIDSGVTTVFDYPIYFALRDAVGSPASIPMIIDILSHDRLYPHPELLVSFLGNHDVPRLASMSGIDAAKLKLAYSMLLTIRGIPELYYGDEIGMTGGGDPDNRHDFPGGFPDDTIDAFIESGRSLQQQEIFSHIQRLLALRRDHFALRRGSLWNIFSNQSTYAFARVTSQETLLVVLNSSSMEQHLPIAFFDTPLAGTTKLTPVLGGQEQSVRDDSVEITVPAQSLQILSVTR